MAEELDKLLRGPRCTREPLERQLQKLADELGAGRQQYEQRAMLPLDLLDAVFPLIADQSAVCDAGPAADSTWPNGWPR